MFDSHYVPTVQDLEVNLDLGQGMVLGILTLQNRVVCNVKQMTPWVWSQTLSL